MSGRIPTVREPIRLQDFRVWTSRLPLLLSYRYLYLTAWLEIIHRTRNLKYFYLFLFLAAQNLQASFKITKGLTFSQDLSNKNSDVFLNLSRQMEYLVSTL